MLETLSEALSRQGFRHDQITSDGVNVAVCFTDVEAGRRFAGSLLSAGIPRRFVNNRVDADVYFDQGSLGRVLELLEWLK